jgi:hypothetical protein
MPIGKQSVLTPEGGIAIYMKNGTGAASVKGTLVCTSDADDFSVSVCAAGDKDTIGVIYDSGVANGDLVRVVVSGVADVLLQDGTAATRGYWCRLSATQAGRLNATNAAPPGGTIVEIDNHFAEVGHSLQSVTAGSNKLCRIALHFN